MILSSFSEYFGDPGDYENGRLSDPVLFLSASIETESTFHTKLKELILF